MNRIEAVTSVTVSPTTESASHLGAVVPVPNWADEHCPTLLT